MTTPSFSGAQITRTFIPLAVIQGLYFLQGGIWPLISMESFLWVTGGKTDIWLVYTVASLLAFIGISLLLSAASGPSHSTSVLGLGSAATLCGVDLIFVSRGTISSIYLCDAFIEASFVLAWVAQYSKWIRWRYLEADRLRLAKIKQHEAHFEREQARSH